MSNNISKLKYLLETIQNKPITKQEGQDFLDLAFKEIKDTKEQFDRIYEDSVNKFNEQEQKLILNSSKLEYTLEELTKYKNEFENEFKKLSDKINNINIREAKDGITPVKGKDYFDGKDAEITDEIKEDISNLVIKDILPEEIKNKLEELDGEDRLDAKYIKNIPTGKGGSFYGGVSGIKEIIAGDNITVDNTNLGYPVVSSTGGGGSGDGDFLADGTVPMTGNLNLAGNKLIGGTDTTSDLYIQTTTGEGTTGADMHFLVGNNGGTEAMTILNSGNVGVGTTSPTEKLHIEGGHVFINGTDSYIYGNNKLSYINMYNNSTGGIDIYNLNGTATTHIYGALTVDGAFSFGGNLSLANGSYITSGPGQVASIVLYDGSTGNLIFKAATTSAAISRMRWYTGTTSTERMRLDETGQLGIGTTSPSTLLDINSDKIRVRTSKTPSSASDTGNAGDICWDSSYIYVCTATNTWKRVAISTW